MATEFGVTKNDIVDFELNLIDTQPGQLGGIHREFMFCGRQDNLVSSLTAFNALMDTPEPAGSE